MRVAIAGGSAAGLSTALLLARAGHDVIVLDRDPIAPAPDVEAAAQQALRPAAPHIVHPHLLLPLAQQLLRQHLPDVLSDLFAAGAAESTLADQMPPWLADRSPRPGDERFVTVMARRSTLDWVLRRTAAAEDGITVRDGVKVTGLITEADSPPQVRGVRTNAGTILADAVVDATGRRSPIEQWLAECWAGIPQHGAAECGLAYYTRHYRIRDDTELPASRHTRALLAHDEFTTGIWTADNDTVLFAIAPLSADRRFRGLTDPVTFTSVLRSVPIHAPWLDVIDPISGVFAMSGLRNTIRRLAVDGRPVVTGLYSVGDSVCTTNPTFGRGIPLALQGAADIAEVIGSGASPVESALELDSRIEARILPYFLDQAFNDGFRYAALRAAVFDEPPPAFPQPDGDRIDLVQLRTAAMSDPDAFRAFFRLYGMLELPESVYTDPDVVARVRDVLSRPARVPPARPTHDELLHALAQQSAPPDSDSPPPPGTLRPI